MSESHWIWIALIVVGAYLLYHTMTGKPVGMVPGSQPGMPFQEGGQTQ